VRCAADASARTTAEPSARRRRGPCTRAFARRRRSKSLGPRHRGNWTEDTAGGAGQPRKGTASHGRASFYARPYWLDKETIKAAETVGGHKSSWNGDDNACTSVRSPPHLLDSRLCLLNCQVPSRVCLWAGRGFARPTRVRVKTKKRRLCVVYSSCKGSIHHAKAKRGCHVFARVAGSACAQLNQRRRGPARVERDWRSRAFSDVDSNQLSLRRVYILGSGLPFSSGEGLCLWPRGAEMPPRCPPVQVASIPRLGGVRRAGLPITL
jgi:hypothetical protein